MDRRTRFISACYGKPVDRPPIWLMRQAGRYMESYRKVRSQVSFVELCTTPRLAAEVTWDAAKRLETDAAIIFSDLLIPLLGMGYTLEYLEQQGPVITPAYNIAEGTPEMIRPEPAQAFPFLGESIALFKQMAPHDMPLIGFAGAPFTLLSYMVEGGTSRQFLTTKRAMFQYPDHFDRAMRGVTDVLVDYALYQISQGVDAIQIFDSWAGCLSPQDYRYFVLPHTINLFERLRKEEVPLIYFLKGSAGYLKDIKAIPADVFSIDSFQELGEARKSLGIHRAVQGNLDPMALFQPAEMLREQVQYTLAQNEARPGYIFNLGHGILKETDEHMVKFLVKTVKSLGRPSV